MTGVGRTRGCNRTGMPTALFTQQYRQTIQGRPRREPENVSHVARRAQPCERHIGRRGRSLPLNYYYAARTMGASKVAKRRAIDA